MTASTSTNTNRILVGMFHEASWRVAIRSTESPKPPSQPRWEVQVVRTMARHGVQVERVHYERRPCGIAFGWRFAPPIKPKGRLVYAHGTGNDALYPQVELARTLVQSGWEVMLFDVDGHGRDSSTYLDGDHAAAAFADALEAARRSSGEMPTYIGGQSFGGALALKAATTGLPVEGVVAVAAPSLLDLTSQSPLSLVYEAWSLVRPAVWRQLQHYGPWGIWPALGILKRKSYPVRLSAAAQRSAPSSAFAYVDAVSRTVNALGLAEPGAHAARTSRRLPAALLIYGGRDHVVAPKQGEAIARGWQTARLLEVPGATHFSLPFETETLDAITAFLASGAP